MKLGLGTVRAPIPTENLDNIRLFVGIVALDVPLLNIGGILVKRKNKITFFILLLVEFIFFYRKGFVMSEMFFFLWFVIFGTFFAFRFIGGNSSLMGIGGGQKFLAAKMAESMYVKDKGYNANKKDLALDIIFVLLAVINLILSFLSYYISR